MLGFATSRYVRDDAVTKIVRQLESYTARKINIVTYERARLDNSIKWEAPAEFIDLQIRGLVFSIWSTRLLTSQESLEQVEEEDVDIMNDEIGNQELYVGY